MQILLDIPDEDVPNKQEIIDISLHFIEGEVCECNYPYIVLPKGHGKLGDLDIILNKAMKHRENYMEAENSSYCRGKLHAYELYVEEVENAPTIIEADTEKKI